MPTYDPTTGLPVLGPAAGTALQRTLASPTAAPAVTADQLQAMFNARQAIAQVAPTATPAAPVPATPAAQTPAAKPAPAAPVAPAVPATAAADQTATPALAPIPMATGSLPVAPQANANAQPYIAGGTPTFANAAVGPLANPEGTINRGFDFQTQRTEHFMQQALNYVDQGSNIFDRATRARAITGILGATAGPNNVGAVQGAGADTLNGSIAGITSAGIGANAQMYGANTGFAGGLARDVSAEKIAGMEVGSRPVQYGNTIVGNPAMRFTVPAYALPTVENGQVKLQPIGQNAQVGTPQVQVPNNPPVGATRTRASGKTERYDGKAWVAEGSQ